MFIIIDNTEDDQITFSALLNKKFVQKVFKLERNQDLLVYLDRWLKQLKKSASDIEGVGVVMGVGKFTGTRLAVTLANTLAFGLHIPVVALKKEFSNEEAAVILREATTGTYVAPIYSAEARIGQ